MNPGARFNTYACLTVLVGVVSFCLADGQTGLAAVAVPIAFLGWLCGRGRASDGTPHQWRPVALPRTLINLLVLLAIVNAAVRASRGLVGQAIVSDLGEFLVYVQLLKLFDRRLPRDESQLLTLSIFVVIAAVLTSNTLPVGACLLLYTPLATVSVMLYQIRSGQVNAASRRGSSAAAAEAPLHAGRKRSAHFRMVVGTSLVAASVLAAVVFVVAPRGLGADSMGRFGKSGYGNTVTGYTSTIALGRSGRLTDSTTPVFDVGVTDEAGRPLGSANKNLYLRGSTLDSYDPETQTWSRAHRSPGRPIEVRGGDRQSINSPGTARAGREYLRITLRRPPSSDETLFTVWRPTALVPSRPSKVSIDSHDASLRRTEDRAGTPSGPLQYIVEYSPSDSTGIQPYSDLGFQQGRIHDLALSVLRPRGISEDPRARDRIANRQAANAIKDYLQSNYAYSRDMVAPEEGQDPIDMFLFQTKAGHCEYFASAMTAICQSVGMQSRIVAGYLAADYNSITGEYLVRESNAHAWCEVHTGEGNWYVIDPSPSAEIDRIHKQTGGLLSMLRRWYDTVEFGWNRSIIGFDATRQGLAQRDRTSYQWLTRMFNRLSDQLAEAGRSRADNARLRATSPIMYLLPIILVLALIVVVSRTGLPAIRLPRIFRRGRGTSSRTDPDLAAAIAKAKFYADAIKALDRANLAKPESAPPLTFASTLAAHSPTAASAMQRIAMAFYRIRFARTSLPPEQAADAEAALAELRAALKSDLRSRDGV